MIDTLRSMSFQTLCLMYAFGFAMFGLQFMASLPTHNVAAQSSGGGGGGSSSSGGGSSEYTATIIGGETEGVSSETTCCNGVVLEFSSVQPANPWILAGEALMVPGISSSYETGNEYSEGYNTLGTVRPGLCFLPDDYCESFEFIHEIGVIGTSEGQAN